MTHLTGFDNLALALRSNTHSNHSGHIHLIGLAALDGNVTCCPVAGAIELLSPTALSNSQVRGRALRDHPGYGNILGLTRSLDSYLIWGTWAWVMGIE